MLTKSYDYIRLSEKPKNSEKLSINLKSNHSNIIINFF